MNVITFHERACYIYTSIAKPYVTVTKLENQFLVMQYSCGYDLRISYQ